MFGKLFSRQETPTPATPIHLFNTETTKLEVFTPNKPGQVLMYSCGLTVYDYAHIGNLRSFVFADILKRTLLWHSYDVNHTINFTDFGHLTDDGDAGEDKIMKGLRREGMPVTLEAMRDLTDIYIAAFLTDWEAMRLLPPTTWARASDYIEAQIRLVETLANKGYAYETSDGVYFDIAKYPRYGRLGNINLETLKSGARVESNPEKHHPADFALWKKGELGWDSRWGKGFPGWHIECSAMAIATLGKQLDIHTGGIDLINTHHNAEIAQSECATGKPFVKYWLHSEFMTIEKVKIGKSLGNAITLRHLHDRGFSGEDYRYWLLTAHYRSPINFSWDALDAAKQAVFRLKRYVYEEYKQKAGQADAAYLEHFGQRLADDLDTPGAIALAWEVVKDNQLDNPTKCATLHAMDSVFEIGLSQTVTEGVRTLGVLAYEEVPDDIKHLIDRRDAARIARNWIEADALRDALSIQGYDIEDTPLGPRITRL